MPQGKIDFKSQKGVESMWECQNLLGHPSAHSPRPKPNWLADSLSLSLSFSLFLSEAKVETLKQKEPN